MFCDCKADFTYIVKVVNFLFLFLIREYFLPQCCIRFVLFFPSLVLFLLLQTASIEPPVFWIVLFVYAVGRHRSINSVIDSTIAFSQGHPSMDSRVSYVFF